MALILNTTWIKAAIWESDEKRKWAAVETLDSAKFKQKCKRTIAARVTARVTVAVATAKRGEKSEKAASLR
ncbi:hypothetical protein [Paenibacillus silvae]|uniref:hypothetical protein n=1 Tax=Paenibacillus silvae TaxID=1325358 RepID=UPI0016423726|nr:MULTISPECIES: hypothetical protein [Paenibacillus]MCK6078538.1 hypothetical protein [Paenibacillus silvae]MCK6152858.1 hypothetical protein [Paenibacillus silvae]MCK6271310.1 hypothetical protein [Paenibacillus silvae]